MNTPVFCAVVLAAGKGSRMRSPLPKVAHLLCGKPLLIWCFESLLSAHLRCFTVVVHPEHTSVLSMISDFQIAQHNEKNTL